MERGEYERKKLKVWEEEKDIHSLRIHTFNYKDYSFLLFPLKGLEKGMKKREIYLFSRWETKKKEKEARKEEKEKEEMPNLIILL